MIDILIVLVSILVTSVFYLLGKINSLQHQVNLLDKEQHEQNKEMLEFLQFKLQQANLNIAIIEKLEEMVEGNELKNYYGIVGEA